MGCSIDKRNAISAVFVGFASLGGFIMGFDTSVISGVKELPAWKERFGYLDGATGTYAITTSDESLVVSILSAGTFFGALSSGLFADGLGRRLAIIITSVLFMVGVAIQVGAPNIAAFAVGRAVTGYGLGAMVACIPTYQSECAPKSIRGALVMGSQLATTIGLLLAAVVNQAALKLSGEKSWRTPIAVQIAFASVLCLGMFFLPESPRFYIKKGRNEDALRSISRLRARSETDPAVVEEYEEMVKSAAASDLNKSSYLDCFKQGTNKTRTRILTGLGFLGVQQLTGINFIFYYGTTFFVNSGIKDAYLINVLTNVVNVAATLPAFVLIDRMGRRSLLIWGAFFLCVFQLIIAIAGVTISIENAAGQRMLVAFVFLYVCAFAVSWGPVAWVLNAEMFPLAVRAKGLAMTNATNWAVNFGISYSVPYLVNNGPNSLGLGAKVYFLWGGLSMFCCIYAYFFIPETKGLTLEQVDMLFLHSSPRKSAAYREQLLREVNVSSIEDGVPSLRHADSQISSDPEKAPEKS
ncbi:unnamed protein product [Rhizoctonia solani]|uniref:Major facilitator superfamily (MFS) profile domain-containing protein n=1 Tax=Rhizoctonia solani TaxID=456999 RepID=A0A8H2Y2B8_9AGAM|nr:unnamed protein product [Rhizoctonia solani]